MTSAQANLYDLHAPVAPTESDALAVRGLTVSYGDRPVVFSVDLTVPKGSMTAIIGPNGSGKTTLLRAINGLERLRGGTINWNCQSEIARERQAFVFQSPVMLRRSVTKNIEYPLRLKGCSKEKIASTISDWLTRIGLEKSAQMDATWLSGGEKQKLALARALACEPELLLLDEPTANLDGSATREIEALLQQAAQDGVRIVMTTHNIAQARRLADEVVFLYRGQALEQGKAGQLLDAPATDQAKAFIRGDIVE